MMRSRPLILMVFAAVFVSPQIGCNSESSTPAAPKAGIADQEALQREAMKTLTKPGNVQKVSPIKN